MTTKLKFTPEIQEELNYERYNHWVAIVRRRMEVLWLKSLGLPHAQIAKLAHISENTMRTYFRLYNEGGITKLKEFNFYRRESELQKHYKSLEAYFQDNPPATIKEAQSEIETLTGIKRSETQVRNFLKKKLKICRRKVGMIPAKANPDEQAIYLEQEIEPRLAEAQAKRRAVFFLDATHFVLAPFLGYLWSLKRIFIRAPSGRQRFNILGALNAITHELITVTNTTYINAESVCELLRKLAFLNLGMPITLFLDNARYQKCDLVRETATHLQIELCFLPTYSPNLNLIERLWRFVKKQCLNSKYYSEFSTFKTAIVSCLDQTHTTHKDELDSLLTLRFQLFEKAQFLAA